MHIRVLFDFVIYIGKNGRMRHRIRVDVMGSDQIEATALLL